MKLRSLIEEAVGVARSEGIEDGGGEVEAEREWNAPAPPPCARISYPFEMLSAPSRRRVVGRSAFPAHRTSFVSIRAVSVGVFSPRYAGAAIPVVTSSHQLYPSLYVAGDGQKDSKKDAE